MSISNNIESALLRFLKETMSMQVNYQPIIIKILLEKGDENGFSAPLKEIKDNLKLLNFDRHDFRMDDALKTASSTLTKFVVFDEETAALIPEEIPHDVSECLKVCGQKIVEWHVHNLTSGQFDLWHILPGSSKEKYPYLEEFRRSNSIGVGWNKVEDVTNLTDEQIREEFKKNYPKDDEGSFLDFTKIKRKDLVVLTKGQQEIIDFGIVVNDYYRNATLSFYHHRRDVVWLNQGPIRSDELPSGSLVGLMATCSKVIKKRDGMMDVLLGKHTKDDQVKVPHMSSEYADILLKKKQLIFYGPPGTGKTYTATNLAKKIIEDNSLESTLTFRNAAIKILSEKNQPMHFDEILEQGLKLGLIQTQGKTPGISLATRMSTDIQKNGDSSIFRRTDKGTYTLNPDTEPEEIESEQKEFIRNVTFHQSYSYEEFIEGIKPYSQAGKITYRIESGIFRTICEEAAADLKNKYVLVIDEINRGNISKIFGEIITLIEKDKRDAHSLHLTYSKESFTVPKNIYIIGTMNTADRSLIQIDAALRRRFAFCELMPKPELLDKSIEGISLGRLLEEINKSIVKSGLREKQVGHSYFMEIKSLKDLQFAFANEIIPLLQDYFFDDYKKLEEILGSDFVDSKNMVIKDQWKKDSQIFLKSIKDILPA